MDSSTIRFACLGQGRPAGSDTADLYRAIHPMAILAASFFGVEFFLFWSLFGFWFLCQKQTTWNIQPQELTVNAAAGEPRQVPRSIDTELTVKQQ